METCRPPSPHTSQQGIALVLVLAFLVLMSALILAFFSTVQTEAQSAKSYSSGVTVKQLVSSATNVVTGQISDATRSMKDPTLAASGAVPDADRLVWASQPGMIRTWDGSGAGWKIFKLYSSRDMVTDFDSDGSYSVKNKATTEVPDNWPSQSALYTDLNEPVLVADPEGKIDRDGRAFRASYPIVHPPTLEADSKLKPIEGFSIEQPPGYGGPAIPSLTDAYDPTKRPGPARTGNPAPMPVMWIYVLKDGTLTVPTHASADGQTVEWTGVNASHKPSRQNPIVGRYAFWTDDETCKLNLNTSSEPTPWDTPRAITIQDLKYGQYQPTLREFQRYPGHPYMTALSPVLFPGTALTLTQKESIYDLVPRVVRGGSTGATVAVGGAQNKLTPDEDRLFATVDEFLFNPNRGDNTLVNAARLRKAKFFLTANSRAPELNMFGQPRVSLWPVHVSTARTAFDKLAAFCSTTRGTTTALDKKYYLQRISSASPTQDWTSIPRNQDLYKYLQAATSRPVPGFGGSLQDSWKEDRDQILTEMLDYIRCVNLADTQAGATKYSVTGDKGGQVAPLRIGNTQGFGRIHTVSQVGIHFICSQAGDKGVSQYQTSVPKIAANERLIEAAILIEPYSPSLGWFRLNENLTYEVELSRMTVNGADLQLPAKSTVKLENRINGGWHMNGRERGGAGGLRGPVQGFGGGNYALATDPNKPRAKVKTDPGSMEFSGGSVTIKIYAGNAASAANLVQTLTLSIPAATLPIPDLVEAGTSAYRGTASTDTKFWWSFRSAAGLEGRYSSAASTPHAPGQEYADPKRRWVDSEGPPGFKRGGLFRKEDVVRSIVPYHGDIRLIAAQQSVSADQFAPVSEEHWSSKYRFVHIFSESAGTHFLYGFANEPGPDPTAGVIPGADADAQLVPSSKVRYHYSRMPEIRPGAGKLYNKWGDFDNGMATWTDGAYINKPDEGNTSSTSGSYAYYSWTFTDAVEVNFSPNRLIPSAGMFGSLPTGVKRRLPWQTLLFRPPTKPYLPEDQSKRHPGADPKHPDHLAMDLFWMPVVEPYAISEPFSTAGKINMNYEIAPFHYIRRATALHGAMKSEEPLLLPNEASKIYKLWDHEVNDNPLGLPNNAQNQDSQVRSDWDKAYKGQAPFDKMRRPIDPIETLAQFDERFNKGEVFRSATQICEMPLVRQGETRQQYETNTIMPLNLITGDNTLERPYTNLYAKLTTRSNTFTVHVRAQVLQQAAGQNADAWEKWSETRDQMLSEFRGSSIVERYIDAGDSSIPDFAKETERVADDFYKFRIVATKKFSP